MNADVQSAQIETLKNEILTAAKDNKINCERARGIAHKQGVSTRVVGDLINELNIKIYDCGLGCF